MGRLIYPMMVSLDGFVSRLDGALDWVAVDEELHRFLNDQHRQIGMYLNGRKTWELMAASWPDLAHDSSAPSYLNEFGKIWVDKPKVVFSRTLETVGHGARLVRDDAVGEVARLKQESDRDMLVGGATFVAALIEDDLVDGFDIFVNPIILGSGNPMFPGPRDERKFRLVETRTFDSGVVYLGYRR